MSQEGDSDGTSGEPEGDGGERRKSDLALDAKYRPGLVVVVSVSGRLMITLVLPISSPCLSILAGELSLLFLLLIECMLLCRMLPE